METLDDGGPGDVQRVFHGLTLTYDPDGDAMYVQFGRVEAGSIPINVEVQDGRRWFRRGRGKFIKGARTREDARRPLLEGSMVNLDFRADGTFAGVEVIGCEACFSADFVEALQHAPTPDDVPD